MPYDSLFLPGACLLATWVLSHAFRLVALRTRLLAAPDHRSAHTVATPTGAGVAFLIAFYAGLLVAPGDLSPVWLGPLFVGLIGLLDDIRPLSVGIRAPLFILAAVWCVFWVGFPPLEIAGVVIDTGWLGLLFGVVSLVWLQNLYNFMDGIDGIAAMEAAFVCLAALLIGGPDPWRPALLLLAAVSLGFLLINWPRARVFMGDVGSGFLGLSLGLLALAEAAVNVFVWMILLGVFVTDACLTLLVRWRRGEIVHQPHNLHAYQHLARRFGASRVLLGLLAVNTLWLLPIAFLANSFQEYALFLLVFATIPLLLAAALCGAGQTEPRLEWLKTTRST
ncbi:MAG: glycosyl transferase [Pseudomonadota bacterium]